MRWERDVSRGAWLADRVAAAAGDMHVAVPIGFEAYARVFHPVTADRLTGISWTELADSGESWPGDRVETRTAAWAEVAAESGATVHPLMQWSAIGGGRLTELPQVGTVGDSGWRYSAPEWGRPGAELVATLARTLAGHTATPTAGVAAVWEGWGGLFGQGRRYLTFLSDDATDAPAPPSIVVPEPALGPEVQHGPRLALPWREHVLFDAGIDEFADADWPERALWVAEPTWPECPSLIWPDDHAWVIVSEIDWDSTVVAGSRAAIDAVLEASGIEALEISERADLSSNGDTVNR
ncbi:hypothetical protein [Agromyces neolithicus]|uniref:DUF2716 domain-containing protein n=1 Tax=Agromyces neolithicus TaxID=269420 RepID=A0ABN2LQG1_9MICO